MSTHANLETLARSYLAAFARKDGAAVRALMAPTVTLRDWVIAESGVDNVLAASERIFASCHALTVDVVNLFRDGNVVLAEIAIGFDGADPIRVLDLIEFDAAARITAIRAFKG